MFPARQLTAILPLLTLACSINSHGGSSMGDDNGEPDAELALESGVFEVRDAELTSNGCGASLAMFFPQELTLTASEDQIIFEELGASASHGHGEFDLDAIATRSFRDDRLACSLDFSVRLEGVVVAVDAADVELTARINATQGEASDDCQRAATEIVGIDSWSQLGGCRLTGSFALERH